MISTSDARQVGDLPRIGVAEPIVNAYLNSYSIFSQRSAKNTNAPTTERNPLQLPESDYQATPMMLSSSYAHENCRQ